MIELSDGDTQVLVAPEAGGALARFAWRGHDVLRPASEEAIAARNGRAMGCYPLVPYSNRIRDARLRAGPRVHRLRPNSPPEPHAMHGVGWQRAWHVAQTSGTRVTLALSHAPDEDWPYRFTSAMAFSLAGSRLEAALEIANADESPFPAGLGFHPFFVTPPGTTLDTAWAGWWTVDERHMPVSRGSVPAEADFRMPREVAGWRVDNPFWGWSREAVFRCATHTARLTASEGLDHAIAYSPGRDFVALEPVSHTIDAFSLSADGIGGTGTRYLAAGETWRVSMIIEVGE